MRCGNTQVKSEEYLVKSKNQKIKNFKDLLIWQYAKTVVLQVYKITATLPRQEVYGLSSQLRRCSVSIPSNIAEGFNRFHNKEYKQFLYIALGSCAELETQLELCQDLGFVREQDKMKIVAKVIEISKMTRTLIKQL